MARVILVTGGSRSGKSSYAQRRAEEAASKKLFVATSPNVDAEMNERIEKHKQDRLGKGWDTVEEQVNLTQVIDSNQDYKVILIDCLTLWINNLMFQEEEAQQDIDEKTVEKLCRKLSHCCTSHPGTIFFVTNEVGSGIVPESATTRLYRDLVGRCNQVIAAFADEVILVSCGIPLTLKNN